MVKHAVEHHADAVLVEDLNQPFEVLVRAEPPVDLIKIDGVVAVPFALEQRIEEHRAHAQLL